MKRGSTNHRHVGIHGGRDLSQRQPPKRLPLLRSCGMMERFGNYQRVEQLSLKLPRKFVGATATRKPPTPTRLLMDRR